MNKIIINMKQSFAFAILTLLVLSNNVFSQSSSDSSKQVILTPPSPEKPRINGAKVFGVRPGSPFLFYVSATGVRPMTFSAVGLPDGLSLDAKTGIITGSVSQKDTYNVV